MKAHVSSQGHVLHMERATSALAPAGACLWLPWERIRASITAFGSRGPAHEHVDGFQILHRENAVSTFREYDPILGYVELYAGSRGLPDVEPLHDVGGVPHSRKGPTRWQPLRQMNVRPGPTWTACQQAMLDD